MAWSYQSKRVMFRRLRVWSCCLVFSGSIVAQGAPVDSSPPAAGQPAPPSSILEPGKLPGPHLVFQAKNQTVDHIPGGQAAQYSFQVRNEGGQDLHLLEVRPGCGCTVVHFDPVVAPGKSATISASVQTQPFWTTFTKEVTVTSNDPEAPTTVLSLVGSVVSVYTVLPAPSQIVPYEDTQPITRVFVVQSHRKEGMKIQLPPATSGPVTAKVEQDPASPDTWKVTAVLTPPESLGNVNGEIDLATDVPGLPPIRLVLGAAGDKGITFWPSALNFGKVHGGVTAPVHLDVSLTSQRATFHVTRVESDDPALKVEYHPTPTVITWYQVQVSYTGGWKKGSHSGNITIYTDLPRVASFKIPYTAGVE